MDVCEGYSEMLGRHWIVFVDGGVGIDTHIHTNRETLEHTRTISTRL